MGLIYYLNDVDLLDNWTFAGHPSSLCNKLRVTRFHST
ncbi:hypothetical protein AFCDBAGC_4657 [Methylobacterium cerastii]|uniref:Uncharacterized protein n=1 Tax=Methylobacterium cerastii TaxID=932741 RepID=A0ABQ4QND5_9HYPH|nr:hypothetical protein AFCDBAGC_4657 [Methylobacterium cerastii]